MGCAPRAVIAILGGILVHLTLGSMYTFGNLSPYIISYLRSRTDASDVSNVDSLWITTVGALSISFGTTLGGITDRKYGPRIATGIGCIIYSASVALTYFTIQRSLFTVTLTYGLLVNFGSAFAYGPPAQTAVKWLPRQPTFAVGIILCGYGGGALVFNQVMTSYVNPDNTSPDFTTSDGERYFTDSGLLDRIPTLFLLLAAIFGTAQFVGIALISLPPNYSEETRDDVDDTTDDDITTATTDDNQEYKKKGIAQTGYGSVAINADHTDTDQRDLNALPRSRDTKLVPVSKVIGQMLRNRNSYIVWFVFLCIDTGMQFAIGLYKAYGQTFISDDHFLALIGSLASLFNCVCRPIWGIVMDKYGFETTVKILSSGFVCLCCSLALTEHMAKEAYMIWICALYAFFCGIGPIAPSTFAKLFGANNMSINMGFIMVAASLSAIIGGLAGLSLKSLIGWHGLFLLSGFLGSIAFFVTFWFNGKDMEGMKI